MALSSQSLVEIVQKRAKRARASVEQAEAQLHAANLELERAIPKVHKAEIEHAFEDTKKAEAAVTSAHEDLHVVEKLLDNSSLPGDGRRSGTGEGLKSLMESLRTQRPPKEHGSPE